MIDKTSAEVAKILSMSLMTTLKVSQERGEGNITKRDLQFFTSGVSAVLLLINEYNVARLNKILDLMEDDLISLLKDNNEQQEKK